MSTQLALKKLERSDPTAAPAGLENAVRDLVSRFAHSTEPARTETDEVMLDVEVDGVRCLMIRLRSHMGRGNVWLSPREQEIARMIAKGYPNKTIAGVLDISSWTVSTYLRRMFAKLGVTSRAAMVARLHEERILPEK